MQTPQTVTCQKFHSRKLFERKKNLVSYTTQAKITVNQGGFGTNKKMERDFLQGHVVTRQGGMVSNCKGRFRLDIAKKFCTVRVVRYRTRLPRGPVDAPLSLYDITNDMRPSRLNESDSLVY